MMDRRSGKYRVRPGKYGKAVLQEWVESFHTEWLCDGDFKWSWQDVPYDVAPAALSEGWGNEATEGES